MKITFRQLTKDDESFLAMILENSFNSDAELAFGKGKKDGPPGYDDGTLAAKILDNPSYTRLIIETNDTPCGVFIFKKGEPNIIHYFCIHADFINQHIGTLAWQEFEKSHEGLWQLDTPAFSKRNHHFYQKNGFIKVGERNYGSAVAFVFEKQV